MKEITFECINCGNEFPIEESFDYNGDLVCEDCFDELNDAEEQESRIVRGDQEW